MIATLPVCTRLDADRHGYTQIQTEIHVYDTTK
jgi:hypothetical protein